MPYIEEKDLTAAERAAQMHPQLRDHQERVLRGGQQSDSTPAGSSGSASRALKAQ